MEEQIEDQPPSPYKILKKKAVYYAKKLDKIKNPPINESALL